MSSETDMRATASGLLVPSDTPLPPAEEKARAQGAAMYWKARYEALEARIADPQVIINAAALVRSAAEVANVSHQSFRQVFESMLKLAERQVRARHAAQQPAQPGRKRRK